MSKFPPTSEGFNNAMEWSKTIPHENGKSLYDFVKIFSSSEEKLMFINRYYGKD